MKIVFRILVISLTLLALSAPLFGKREPLTEVEINQLRDAAQEPEKRLRLYASFIRARSTELEQLRSDPRFSADSPAKIHDLLDDLTALLDEVDDNLDQYADRKADVRKPLKEVIALDGDLQAKLGAFKQAGLADGKQDPHSYAFALDRALDAVNGSLDHARRLQQEQEDGLKTQKKH